MPKKSRQTTLHVDRVKAARQLIPGLVSLTQGELARMDRELQGFVKETDDVLFAQTIVYGLERSRMRDSLRAVEISRDTYERAIEELERPRLGTLEEFLAGHPKTAARHRDAKLRLMHRQAKAAMTRLRAIDQSYGDAGLFRLLELGADRMKSRAVRELLGEAVSEGTNVVNLNMEEMRNAAFWNKAVIHMRAEREAAWKDATDAWADPTLGVVGLTKQQLDELEKEVGILQRDNDKEVFEEMVLYAYEWLRNRDKLINRRVRLGTYNEYLGMSKNATKSYDDFIKGVPYPAKLKSEASKSMFFEVLKIAYPAVQTLDLRYGNAGLYRLAEVGFEAIADRDLARIRRSETYESQEDAERPLVKIIADLHLRRQRAYEEALDDESTDQGGKGQILVEDEPTAPVRPKRIYRTTDAQLADPHQDPRAEVNRLKQKVPTRIDPDLIKQMKHAADREGITQRAWLERAIRRELKGPKPG